MMNQQSISNSPDTAPMMENVNTFKEKLEVLPPDVLETWLRHNQNHPFAFIGLGVKAEQEKMRAGRQAGPTPTVYEEQVGNRGMTSLGMPGNPDAMTPQMATRMVEGVNTPRDMSQIAARPGTEGVAGLPTPSDMYMNNGGIVGFAAGDLVGGDFVEEDPVGDPAGPSYWDQAKNWAGETFSREGDAWDTVGNVANFLVQPESYKDMAYHFKQDPAGIVGRGIAGGALAGIGVPTAGVLGAVGLGTLKYGGRFIPGRLAREVSKMSKKDIAKAWYDPKNKLGIKLRKAFKGKGWATTRPKGVAPGTTNKLTADAITSALGRQALPKIAGAGAAAAALMGASEIQEILTDPRYSDEQKEQILANAEKTKADAAAAEAEAEAERLAAIEAERLAAIEAAKAAAAPADAAGDAEDPPKAMKKDREISALNEAYIRAGAKMMQSKASTFLGAAGEALEVGLGTLGVRKKEAREDAKAASEIAFKEATILQGAESNRIKLDYNEKLTLIAGNKLGLNQDQLLDHWTTWQSSLEARAIEAKVIEDIHNKRGWWGNFFSFDVTKDDAGVATAIRLQQGIAFRMWLNAASRHGMPAGVGGLASLGASPTSGGVPPTGKYSYEPIPD